jgi:hypothetical protein
VSNGSDGGSGISGCGKSKGSGDLEVLGTSVEFCSPNGSDGGSGISGCGKSKGSGDLGVLGNLPGALAFGIGLGLTGLGLGIGGLGTT